jgi:hypothetical protein
MAKCVGSGMMGVLDFSEGSTRATRLLCPVCDKPFSIESPQVGMLRRWVTQDHDESPMVRQTKERLVVVQ